MKSVEEKYHIVADSKLKGTYYVSHTSTGGGCYEFILTKSPHKYYSSLQEIIPMKLFFEQVVKSDGVFTNGEFTDIDSELIKEIGGIVNVKIQKSIVTKSTEISYVG